jgi:hypothetical protein
MGPPLYRASPNDPQLDKRPFVALPGYIYTYDGVDYDHDAAMWLTAEQGSIAGWRWRKEG